jgi:glycosyltransferase involved in cell wall biosynthesis
MNKQKLITVITVVYNGEKLLENTIKSVISQPYDNIEYVIIDGCSTDGTVDIIKKYENNITYWLSEKDNGIYDAMNKGIKQATGKGLLFLNAGDFFVGKVLTNDILIPSYLNVKTANKLGFEKDIKIKSHKKGMPNCHQGIIFENKNIKYNLDYKIAADYDYFLRHGYTSTNLPKINTDGHVFYDNFGLSKQNFILRDLEVSNIINVNFGILYYLKFKTKSMIKSLIKIILNRLNNYGK